jgi:hypothetical protein
MVAGNWLDPDGLFRQYGTAKAVPTPGGDYLSYGEWRDIEFNVNLASLAPAGTYIIGNTTFLGTNIFIESVNMDVEVAGAGGTSVSLGTRRLDRTTDISTTNLLVAQSTLTAGTSVTVTNVGLAGSVVTTAQLPDGAAYVTATSIGTFTAGVVKFRIRYRGFGTITQ